MFQGESDAFQIKECNIQLVIYVLPHFLFIRQNGINNWSTQGQHLLLSGFVEKVERGGQNRECFLLSFQHLFSSGHGDDGSWRKHSQPDVRGTTHTHTHIHTHTHSHTLDLFHQRDAMLSPIYCVRITRNSRGFSCLYVVCAGFLMYFSGILHSLSERGVAGERARTHIDYSYWLTSLATMMGNCSALTYLKKKS